jgi:hypothetical protein
MVYTPLPLNRLIATAILCGLFLQGCRSSLQVAPEEPILKKLRKTSDDVQATDQVSVPGVPFDVRSDVLSGRLPGATPPTILPLGAIYTVRIAPPTYHLAVKPGALSHWKQVPSKDLEATDPRSPDRPTLVFGAREWRQYFGEVGTASPLPSDLGEILNSPCPFCPEKVVRDTHLLVLIPAKVNGKPFSLDLLGELIQHPRGGGYSTEYRVYDSDVQEQLGTQSPARPYWVLMTWDVLEGSRNERYASQQALVAGHAKRAKLPYELPGVLEAATAMLSHYVRSRERLYTDAPWTYTRCRELVARNHENFPAVVGGFSSGGSLSPTAALATAATAVWLVSGSSNGVLGSARFSPVMGACAVGQLFCGGYASASRGQQ